MATERAATRRSAKRFNDELGFIPRVGVNEMNAQINRTFRPNWLPRSIREIGPHWVLVAVQPRRMEARSICGSRTSTSR